MKSFYKLCTVCILFFLSGISAGATIVIDIGYNQAPYQNGQVANIDCSQTKVDVGVREEGTHLPRVTWSVSSNFSYTSWFGRGDVIVLTLDPNRNNGYVTANFNGTIITVYIVQKTTPTLTITPTLCTSGQTGNFAGTLNYYGPNSANFVWETSGGITVNGSNYYRVIDNTISSATIQHNYSGFVTVYGEIPGCNNIRTHPIKFFIGKPQVNFFTVNGQTGFTTMCLGNSQDIQTNAFGSPSSYHWYVSSGNGGDAYLTDYGGGRAYFNTYIPGCYGLTLEMTNECGTSTDGLTICAQDCFSPYRITPNPGKDKVSIVFEDVQKKEALPDYLELVSEKSMNTVRRINVNEVFEAKAFKNDTIEFDVQELPRGVYYLRVANSRQIKEKQVEMIRLLFE